MSAARGRFCWAIVTICACGTGCATRDPSIAVVSVQPGAASAEAMELRFTLQLDNPNSNAELRLENFKYDVAVNGRNVYRGVHAAEATLAASSERQLVLPAVIRFADAGWDAPAAPTNAEFSIDGSVTYLEPGEVARVLLDMGFPLPSAGFRGQGKIGEARSED